MEPCSLDPFTLVILALENSLEPHCQRALRTILPDCPPSLLVGEEPLRTGHRSAHITQQGGDKNSSHWHLMQAVPVPHPLSCSAGTPVLVLSTWLFWNLIVWYESQLCHFQALQPQARCLTSLCPVSLLEKGKNNFTSFVGILH